jgi:hypothetical protein
VSACVRKQHAVTVLQEHPRVPGYAFPIVCDAVQQHNRRAIRALRLYVPCAQRRMVRLNLYILEFSVELLSDYGSYLFFVLNGTVPSVQ